MGLSSFDISCKLLLYFYTHCILLHIPTKSNAIILHHDCGHDVAPSHIDHDFLRSICTKLIRLLLNLIPTPCPKQQQGLPQQSLRRINELTRLSCATPSWAWAMLTELPRSMFGHLKERRSAQENAAVHARNYLAGLEIKGESCYVMRAPSKN